MTYTTEKIKLSARKIQQVVGRCGECRSFRYNNFEVEYPQGIKPVCDNCITKLHNMQVLEFVKPELKQVQINKKPERIPKKRVAYTAHNIKTGTDNAQKILDYIKSSAIPLTKKEIYEYIKLSEAGTRRHLNEMVEKKLLCKSDSFKPCWIDVDRKHLLETRMFLKKEKQSPLEDPLNPGKCVRKKTLVIRQALIDHIKQSPCPLSSTQISKALGYSYRWTTSRLIELKDAGIVSCLEKREFLWIDVERESLLKPYEITPTCNKYVRELFIDLLTTSEQPLRITDICKYIRNKRGKVNRNQLYSYIKYLESQGLVRGEYKQTEAQGTYYGLTSRPEIIDYLEEIKGSSTRNRIVECLKLGGMFRKDLVSKLNEIQFIGEQSVFHELRRMASEGLVTKTQLTRRTPAIYTLNDIIE